MLEMNEQCYLNLAGQFYVAAELQRRHIYAVVRFFLPTEAFLVAYSLGKTKPKSIEIEVRSTKKSTWEIDRTVSIKPGQIWVFVVVPEDEGAPAEFYVLNGSELLEKLGSGADDSLKKHKEEPRKTSVKPAIVTKVTKKQVEAYKNAWGTVLKRLQP